MSKLQPVDGKATIREVTATGATEDEAVDDAVQQMDQASQFGSVAVTAIQVGQGKWVIGTQGRGTYNP